MAGSGTPGEIFKAFVKVATLKNQQVNEGKKAILIMS
jgi:hypothetical protein